MTRTSSVCQGVRDLVHPCRSPAPGLIPVSAPVRGAFEKGLLTLPCGKSTIRLSPPLICTDSDADKAVAILDEVLTEVEAAG